MFMFMFVVLFDVYVCCLLFVDVYVLMFMLFCFDVYVFLFLLFLLLTGPIRCLPRGCTIPSTLKQLAP